MWFKNDINSDAVRKDYNQNMKLTLTTENIRKKNNKIPNKFDMRLLTSGTFFYLFNSKCTKPTEALRNILNKYNKT